MVKELFQASVRGEQNLKSCGGHGLCEGSQFCVSNGSVTKDFCWYVVFLLAITE